MQNGLQRISKLKKSSSFQRNSVLHKSSFVDWASHPDQIFGLVQTQSKRSLTVYNGLQRNSNVEKLSYVDWTGWDSLTGNSVLHKSSYVALQCNSVLQKSSYVDWASPPSPDIWTGLDAVQEDSKCPEWTAT